MIDRNAFAVRAWPLQARLQWALLLAALGVWLVLTVAALAWLRVAQAQAATLAATARGAVPPAASAAAPLPSRDFVPSLPRSVAVPSVLHHLQRTSQQVGATLGAVTVQEHPPSASDLGRSEFRLNLRGPYAAVKRVLGDTLARYPSATLHALNWRLLDAAAPAGGTASASEAEATVVIWTAPVATPLRR